MAASISIEDDAGEAIASADFGTIDGDGSSQLKFRVENIGNQNATSVQVNLARLSANDGLDYATVAYDNGGNPLAYSQQTLSFNTMAPGDIAYFWVKVAVPAYSSPAGNPRQFSIQCQYSGT